MANRGKTLDQQVFCIKDLERLGSEKMLKTYREYYNEGAMDLITIRENESSYDRYMIRPRVLRNISSLDPSTSILGCKVKFPFGFSPTAMQTLAHPDGEEGTSKACANFNTLMGLSNYSTIDLEKVIAHGAGNPYVMHTSLLKNKNAMIRMIKRAEVSGYKALFVTLDVPFLGRRLNEFRNNFGVPKGMEYPNLFPGVDVTNLEDVGDSMAYDDSLEWSDIIPFFRQHTKMEIWGKGIYTAADAELAIKHGFDGIIISNHGGRQLDSVPASLDVLREIVPVAKGKIPIAVDGGIRRGTDIFKALALGADFCLAGRPAIWGLAYDGQRGVELALNLLYDEFKTCMALAGCKNVSEIQTDHVSLLQPDGRLLKL
ncbi:FMN-dependent dehydrogenase [Penicillium capsulatum]|uniref:Oxidase FUB9 n=1 Tax=Penicillium capsulatum TaxID=69766 RepID=A0A9W9I1K9_9EURO|nr:FMN-dependent dehydrogenase [Penicillium capsulatum]KAJ6117046.1 FMN-dependent dehydrogenase [Penicillium capsulatum]